MNTSEPSSDQPSAVARDWPNLGILDFLPVAQNEGPEVTLGTTVEIAIMADRLGFWRYWMAEHWASGVATASPELLTAVIASLTGRIRVGPAGILLRLYSPLKVASNALLVEALFPGRTELGLARGSASREVTRALLATDSEAAQRNNTLAYVDKVAEVLDYLAHRGPVSAACPRGAGSPEVWILGSGGDSASLASRLGTGFALSLFHRETMPDPASMDHDYRSMFRLSSRAGAPRLCLAIAGACCDTDAEARRVAAAYPNPYVRPTIVGTPDRWVDELGCLTRRYAADEVVVLDLCQRREDRFRTLELLADAFFASASAR